MLQIILLSLLDELTFSWNPKLQTCLIQHYINTVRQSNNYRYHFISFLPNKKLGAFQTSSMSSQRFTSLLQTSRLSYSPWKPIRKSRDWFRLYGHARVKMFHGHHNWRHGFIHRAAFERPCRNRFPVPDRPVKHPARLKADPTDRKPFLGVSRRFTRISISSCSRRKSFSIRRKIPAEAIQIVASIISYYPLRGKEYWKLVGELFYVCIFFRGAN